MSSLQQIAARRAALIARAARQRAELGECYRRLERPAAVFDKGVAVARSVRSHPALAMAVGGVAVFLLRRHISLGKLSGAVMAAAKMGIPLAKALWLRRTRPQISE